LYFVSYFGIGNFTRGYLYTCLETGSSHMP